MFHVLVLKFPDFKPGVFRTYDTWQEATRCAEKLLGNPKYMTAEVSIAKVEYRRRVTPETIA